VELPETWVEEPDNASEQYNQHADTGNIPNNFAMGQTNLEHAEAMDAWGLWSKKVVVSDFVVVVEVYQSNENLNDNQTLHRYGSLDREVDSLIPVDDSLQLQVGFLYSIWVLVPVGHGPGVAV